MSDLTDPNNLSNLTTQTTRLADAMEELNRESGEAAAKTERHAVAERGLAEITAKLNEVLPGLGSALDLLTQGYRGSAEAAEAGAAANESFIASLGPIAVVLLGIQTAMQYWDMYKDKVKEAQEAQSEALEKMTDSLNKAREAQDKFFDSQHPEDDPIRKIENDFDRNMAVSRAQVEGHKKVLQTEEGAELANAKSPKEKEKIRQNYEGLNAQQDKLLETKTANAKQDEMGELNDAITKATNQGDALRQQILTARKAGDTKKVDELTGDWGKVSDQLKLLNDKKESLGADIAKDQAVAAVNAMTDRQVTAARTPDDTVANALNAFQAEQHGKIAPAQQNALNALQNTFDLIGGNVDAMNTALKYALDHFSNQAQEIAYIKRQLAALAIQR